MKRTENGEGKNTNSGLVKGPVVGAVLGAIVSFLVAGSVVETSRIDAPCAGFFIISVGLTIGAIIGMLLEIIVEIVKSRK